jgi:hypothetical protein
MLPTLRRLCRPCIGLQYLRRHAAYVAALPLNYAAGQAVWALWGSPLQGLRVTIAAARTRMQRALRGLPLRRLRVTIDAARTRIQRALRWAHGLQHYFLCREAQFVVNRVEARGTKRLCPESATPQSRAGRYAFVVFTKA